MSTDAQGVAVSKLMLWGGRIMSGLIVVGLSMSGVMKFVQPTGMDKEFERLGWDMNLATTLGVLELVCVVIYAIPRTSILGAILLTGYLGGATATHVRIIDPFYGPVIGGILAWGGLWLRDPRVRALVPWSK